MQNYQERLTGYFLPKITGNDLLDVFIRNHRKKYIGWVLYKITGENVLDVFYPNHWEKISRVGFMQKYQANFLGYFLPKIVMKKY